MATRLRLPAPLSVPTTISPAFSVGWEETANAVRAKLGPRRYNTPRAAFIGPTESSTTDDRDVLAVQYVSDPLAAQTISGTVKGILAARESNTGANARAQMRIRVVTNDGSTDRGVLLDFDTSALTNELTTSASPFPNVKYPRGYTGDGGALSSVTAQAGDRLVIEIGVRAHNTSGSAFTFNWQIGDDVDLADCAEDEVGTTGAAWIEFSADLVWGSNYTVSSLPITTAYTGGLKQAILDARAAGHDEVRLAAGTYTYGTVTNDTAGTKMLRARPAEGVSSESVIVDDGVGVKSLPTNTRYLSFEDMSIRRGFTIENTYRFQVVGCKTLNVQVEGKCRSTTIQACDIGGVFGSYSLGYGILFSPDDNPSDFITDTWITHNRIGKIDSATCCRVAIFDGLDFGFNYMHDIIRVTTPADHTDGFRTFEGGKWLRFHDNIGQHDFNGQFFFINGGRVDHVRLWNNVHPQCLGSYRTFAVDDDTSNFHMMNGTINDASSFSNSSTHQGVVIFNMLCAGGDGIERDSGTVMSDLKHDYNVWGAGVTPTGLTASANQSLVAPTIVSAVAEDFRLTGASASGLNFGVASYQGVEAPAKDRVGNTRSFPCEAGALERQAGDP